MVKYMLGLAGYIKLENSIIAKSKDGLFDRNQFDKRMSNINAIYNKIVQSYVAIDKFDKINTTTYISESVLHDNCSKMDLLIEHIGYMNKSISNIISTGNIDDKYKDYIIYE